MTAKLEWPKRAVVSPPLFGSGAARFTVEFFRQPDADKGLILFNWMAMGQKPIGLKMGNRNF